MPSGGQPKVYDPELVAQVSELYAEGHTQVEVGEQLGLSQKVIWNLMRRHRLPRRPPAKRDQTGERNAYWRGGDAGYAALHKRVERARGRPPQCEKCETTEGPHDWANLTGNYADVEDFMRMCRPCHREYDGRERDEHGRYVPAGGDADAR